MNLWNNFTYFLNFDDRTTGDQFRQLDDRVLGGAEASHVFPGDLFGMPMENEVGVQTRTDSMRVGLFDTTRRQFRRTVIDDQVLETSAAFYVENRVRWTDWLRTSVGFRADGYYAMSAPTRRPIRGAPGTASSTRSSASCSDRGPTPNFT